MSALEKAKFIRPKMDGARTELIILISLQFMD